MGLHPHVLADRSRWLVNLRWIALVCIGLFVWICSQVLDLLDRAWPCYIIVLLMAAGNAAFAIGERRGRPDRGDGAIALQIAMDQIGLTGLLFFTCFTHNPFISYFVFHAINAGLLMKRRMAFVTTGMGTVLIGGVILAQCFGLLPAPRLNLPHMAYSPTESGNLQDRAYLVGLFVASASTLWFAVYVATSIRDLHRRAQAEMRQQEKILGIGQLVAGFAHQIGNPLDGMQNCIRLLGEQVKDNPRLVRYTELITQAAARIEATARRVQAFARPHGMRMQAVDVNETIRATLLLLGTTRLHGVHIRTELGSIPRTRCDDYSLQEVIFNLCTNALAATPSGGSLTLRTRALTDEAFPNSLAVEIEVADTGEGIPEQVRDRVFEPFFTTRTDRGGTGIGLGLCRMLISEMGGRIEFDSEVGEGTTFRIVLGAQEEQPPNKDAA